MNRLKAWKAANGRGTITYTDVGDLFILLNALDAYAKTTNIWLFTHDDITVTFLKSKLKYINITKAIDSKDSLDKHVIILLNPELMGNLSLEIALVKRSKFYLVISKDIDKVPQVVLNQFKRIYLPKPDNKHVSYYHKILDFKGEELDDFTKIDNTMTEIMGTFGDYDSIMKSIQGDPVTGLSPRDFRLEFAQNKGWSMNLDQSIPMFKDIYELYHPDAIYDRADIYNKLIHKRAELLSNNDSLVNEVVSIYNHNPKAKILVISKNGKVNDKIVKVINENTKNLYALKYKTTAISLHSDMTKLPLLDDENDDYIRYKSGANKGDVKLFGVKSLTTYFVKLFNYPTSLRLLAITGSIDKTIRIQNVDILIITSLKTLSYIELKNRLKSLYCPKIIHLLMNNDKTLKVFNHINLKNHYNSKIL